MTERQLRRTLARNIKAAREACGLSVTEAAKRAGIEQPYWSMIEGGGRLPSLKVLLKMMDVLNCEVGELFRKK